MLQKICPMSIEIRVDRRPAESVGFPHVNMEMTPGRVGAVTVSLIFELDRNRDKASVAHAAFGGDVPSKTLNVARRTPQHRHFHAAVVIEMDMHRRNRQVVVVVKRASQALCQFALPMTIDVDERGHR